MIRRYFNCLMLVLGIAAIVAVAANPSEAVDTAASNLVEQLEPPFTPATDDELADFAARCSLFVV